MILGIMQPYFFPYIGYYDLINRSDRWVVFDVVKYTPKSWMNRNRILHPQDGWQYVSVPVNKHVEGGAIKDIAIIDKDAAHKRIIGQLQHYRHARAPFFDDVCRIIDETFKHASTAKLRDLNVASLELVCRYLGIPFNSTMLSESGIELPAIDHPGQWALEISTALGASEYVNPPNGKPIFKQDEFDLRGITLTFTTLPDYRYDCGPYDFVEHLSIIDVLMWNTPSAVKAYLDARKPPKLAG